MSTYTVRYERDEDGWWFTSVPKIPGCWTQGRTLDQARRRIREALALWVKDAKTATLVDDIRLPAGVRGTVKASQALVTDTARVLTQELRLSPADAGAVLGLPPAWVKTVVIPRKRIVKAAARRRAKAAGRRKS